MTDYKWLVLALLPLVALGMILIWFIVLSRGGQPINLSLKGFGVSIALTSPSESQKGTQNGLHS